MTEAVLDASVVIKWFRSAGERHADHAQALRRAFEDGELYVFAPPLMAIEIINVAGRRWRWEQQRLEALAGALHDLGFELSLPPMERVAHWTATGLTAYDSVYVALAEGIGVELITDDEAIVELVPAHSRALSAIEPG